MRQTSVDWLVEQLLIYGDKAFNKEITLGQYHIKKQELIEQAKEMEKEQIIESDLNATIRTAKGCNADVSVRRVKELAEQYYEQTYVGNHLVESNEMIDHIGDTNKMVDNRKNKLETLAKILAKIWFYCDWKWESPSERVMQMLMQDLSLYPFKNEDEMIQQTQVDDVIYKEASKTVHPYGKISEDLVENHIPDVRKMAEDDELNFIKKQLENVEHYRLGYNSAKKTLYTEEEVLQLLLRLQQTESYDNLYDWFEQFKK